MDWEKTAQQIAQFGPEPDSLSAVSRFLHAGEGGRCWAVACSGGADSVYLVLWLWIHYFRNGQANGVVLHYNHRVRGESASQDAEWVGELAAALGLEYCSAESDKDHSVENSEAVLREERLAFFHRVMQERRIRLLFTGHQAEDVAEWLLMRLARGSGSTGLSGPRPVQPFRKQGVVHLRPLLEVGREEIRSRLLQAGIQWREDVTNEQEIYSRNALRKRVIPVWQAVEPRPLMPGIARSRALLEEEDDALEQYLQQWTEGMDWGTSSFDWKGKLPPRALLRRAWFRWARRQDEGVLDRGSRFVEAVIQAVTGAGPVIRQPLSEGLELQVSPGIWKISRIGVPRCFPPGNWPLVPGSLLVIPGAGLLRCRRVTDGEKSNWLQRGFPDAAHQHRMACIQEPQDIDIVSGVFRVRTMSGEELYQPIGKSRPSVVTDLLKKNQVPAAERKRKWGVYTHQGALIWVPGFSPSVEWALKDCKKNTFALDFIPFICNL